MENVELIKSTSKKIKIIRDWLKVAQDKQKSYANTRMRVLKFEVGDMVFLKVAPWKCMIWFQKQGNLNPRYIEPFRILERIGPMAYRLKLPRNLEWIHDVFHVSMLKKYILDLSHVLETPPVELREDLSFKVQPVGILDHIEKVLRNKVVSMVKILWRN